jgi:hypothetical protein
MPAKKATPKKAAKTAKASKSPSKSVKKAPAKREGCTTVSKRDAAVKESGVDLAEEAPQRERHGDGPAMPGAGAAHARETLRHNKEAEHAHRDPRGEQAKMDGKFARAKHDPRKEYGQAKDRQVPRMSGMVNWFRRAPKPKGGGK